MTRTTPFRRTILHFSQTFLTDALTFIVCSGNVYFGPLLTAWLPDVTQKKNTCKKNTVKTRI